MFKLLDQSKLWFQIKGKQARNASDSTTSSAPLFFID